MDIKTTDNFNNITSRIPATDVFLQKKNYIKFQNEGNYLLIRNIISNKLSCNRK